MSLTCLLFSAQLCCNKVCVCFHGRCARGHRMWPVEDVCIFRYVVVVAVIIIIIMILSAKWEDNKNSVMLDYIQHNCKAGLRCAVCGMGRRNEHDRSGSCVHVTFFYCGMWFLLPIRSEFNFLTLNLSGIFGGEAAQLQLSPPHYWAFLCHTPLDTHTPGRTPLNEWSALRRVRYLHTPQQTEQTTRMPSAAFKPQGMKRLQSHALDCTAIWIVTSWILL